LHRIHAWGRLLVAVCLASTCVGAATAQDYAYESLPEWYVGGLAGAYLPDSARGSDTGANLQLVLGSMLAESLAIELTGFGADGSMGGGLDLTLGTPAAGNPFFLVGAGGVQHDIGTLSESGTYFELGLGAYLPVSSSKFLWRLEARYQLVSVDAATSAGNDLLEDGRINLGILFGQGEDRSAVQRLEEPESAADADEDGVPDNLDECPDTPKWMRADARGCSPDADGDGVDDSRDNCPETAGGGPIDANGCPQKEQAAVVTTGDEDGDGVPDDRDACPHTAGNLAVDEKGCVRPEDVKLHNVHFDLESSRLTGDGFILLRQVAAALKADPEMRLEIGGHTDATGNRVFNEKLSIERAETVNNFLSYLGIDEKRFVLKAYGELRPLADNKTDEGRAYNRRVEFRRLD
jgi:OOP family OmpA-OmpF porin